MLFRMWISKSLKIHMVSSDTSKTWYEVMPEQYARHLKAE